MSVVTLGAIGESYGRRVLVQNLRHIVVGLSALRALWPDYLLTSALLTNSTHSHDSSGAARQTHAGFEGLGGVERWRGPMGAVAAGAAVSSTSTSTSSCFEPGGGWGNQERRCCMVKVRPDVEAYRSASVEGVQGKWVCVNDILPMSDYDLEAYNTYRHQLQPSSEFDLQRHDPALQVRYRTSSSCDFEDTRLVF